MKRGLQKMTQLTRLRHSLHVIALNDKLVLHLGGSSDGDTRSHLNLTDVLLTEEVTDLHGLVVVRDDTVDGEMSIHSTHLVPEALQ